MTVARAGAHPSPGRRPARLAAITAVALAAFAGAGTASALAAPPTGVDLATYKRVGRFDLPVPGATTPAGDLLSREASAVTYNPDTDTLFLVGDEGTSIVQVRKDGTLVDTMTLGTKAGSTAPEFEDTEGLAYVGNGRFVLTEERTRQVNRFVYVGGGTLRRTDVQTVKLGPTVGNEGIEGVTNDPATGGLVGVKEMTPQGLFATTVDFVAGTATNGSATTAPTDLFDPAKVGTADLSDVYALANVPSVTGAEAGHLLVISQESGRVVEVDRTGTVDSTLTIQGDADNPLTVPAQTHEGVTMDADGHLYVVNEGGGGTDRPQLWVYAPSSVPNQAPTGVTLDRATTTLAENTSTVGRLKVADVTVADDGLGTNTLAVTGSDAAAFEVDNTGLYLKAGTKLDYETKASYTVRVAVDDAAVGLTPDATTAPYTLTVSDLADETTALPSVTVSEVAPWGSGDSTYRADWFEVTNTGTTPVDLAGWRVDDSSNAFASGVALTGVDTLAPGRSAVFVNGDAAAAAAFKASWFGADVPAGLQVGTYTGNGIGLSTDGDAVNLFTKAGDRVTGVAFDAATTRVSFDNGAGAGSATPPTPTISTLSAAGKDGAFVAGGETGSPGLAPVRPIVSEVAPWGSKDGAYEADWFEVTNPGLVPLDLTGWKVDDSSADAAAAVALSGVSSIPAGGSAVFLEGDATTVAAFAKTWFGGETPKDVRLGTYTGKGIGLSTDGDAVVLFDAAGRRSTGVAFGASTSGVTFDNAAGVGSTTAPLPTVDTLSVRGRNGAFRVGTETGSPATVTPDTTGPTVTFTGNAGTYTVGERVSIGCTAVDEPRGSGVAESTCPLFEGPAESFGLGVHEHTGTARDHAGNVTTTTVRFEVVAAPAPPALPTAPLTAALPGPLPAPAPPKAPTAPQPKAKVATTAGVNALHKGIVARLSGLQAGSRITIVVRRGDATLKTVRGVAGRNGTRRLTIRLTRPQLATLRGRTLTIRTTTVGADGTTQAQTTRLTVR
jgi:uncharacterized protein YjiK